MESEIPFLELEVKLIQECDDLDPITWVKVYWEKFRKIVEADPTLTEHQIKHALYLQK